MKRICVFCGLLNVSGYYDRLKGFFDHMVAEGFLSAGSRALLSTAGDADQLLDLMAGLEHASGMLPEQMLDSPS